LGGDQRLEAHTVVMRRDGGEAARSDRGDAGPLGLDPPSRLAVVTGGDELLLAGAHLQRKCSLRRLRQHRLERQPESDLAVETETVEPAGGEDEGVEPALLRLAQASLDIAAQRLDRERRLEGEQLRLPSDGGGADEHAGPNRVSSDESIARVVPREVRAHRESLGVRGGHVLRRVDGDVDPAGEQCLLDLLDEDAAGADLPEGTRAVAVAGGGDRDEGDLVPAATENRSCELRLREGEPRPARPDANEHSPSSS